jgi:L-gulono-1,4-lactone dehydrogenase
VSARWRSWSGRVTATPAAIARPSSVAEVQETVRRAAERGLRVRPVGSGHSFTPLAWTDGVLVDLARLRGLVGVDAAAGVVRLRAGTPLHEVPALLAPHGLAMENLGDIDRQTIAGAVSTGTHGTGARFGGLASRVVGATLVLADGGVLRVGQDASPELVPAVALSLGALGILVEVELACVPAFLLHAVERPEPFEAVSGALDARFAGADHFECYWWPHTATVMTRTNTRLPADAARRPPGAAARWLDEQVVQNGVLGLKSALGRAVPALTPPLNRLATRAYGDLDIVDRSHEVFTSPRRVRFVESEYAVPRAATADALRAVRRVVERGRHTVSFPVEVRVAAADDRWLSTAHERDSGYVAVHRWRGDDERRFFREVDAALRDHDGRPHWGKLHHQDAASLAPSYPRFGDFLALRDRLDPERRFANPHLEHVLGA